MSQDNTLKRIASITFPLLAALFVLVVVACGAEATPIEGSGTFIVGEDISPGYYIYPQGEPECTFTRYVPDWANLKGGEWKYEAKSTIAASTSTVRPWIYLPYEGMKVLTIGCGKWKWTAEAHPLIEGAAAAQHLQTPPPVTCVWTDDPMLMPNLGEVRRTRIPSPLGHAVPECDRYWHQDWDSILRERGL